MNWLLVSLTLLLPATWQQTALRHETLPGVVPGTEVKETFASWKQGSQELYAFHWIPYPPRPGGPLVSVEQWPGHALGREVAVIRTSQFLGTRQEVLVTHLDLKDAQFMTYARGMSKDEFQAVLDGLELAVTVGPGGAR